MDNENIIVLDNRAMDRIQEIASNEFSKTNKSLTASFIYALEMYLNIKGGKPGFVVKLKE